MPAVSDKVSCDSSKSHAAIVCLILGTRKRIAGRPGGLSLGIEWLRLEGTMPGCTSGSQSRPWHRGLAQETLSCQRAGLGWNRYSCSHNLRPPCWVPSLPGAVRPCSGLGVCGQPWSGTGGWRWTAAPRYLGIYLPLDGSLCTEGTFPDTCNGQPSRCRNA